MSKIHLHRSEIDRRLGVSLFQRSLFFLSESNSIKMPQTFGVEQVEAAQTREMKRVRSAGELLLDAQADVSLETRNGATASQLAANGGHTAIVEAIANLSR